MGTIGDTEGQTVQPSQNKEMTMLNGQVSYHTKYVSARDTHQGDAMHARGSLR